MKCDLLILDADDTLWESAIFFERSEHDFLEVMHSLGFDRDNTAETVRKRDVQRLSVTGYGARPYADTLRSILHERVQSPPEWVIAAMNDIEKALLEHPVVLLPGVMEALLTVRRLGIRSVVYTLGEMDHQHHKFLRSGLEKITDDFRVVQEKNAENLRLLVNDLRVNPSECILVGNSPRSDINPALELGIPAVHLLRDRSWAAEREDYIDPGAVMTISSMHDLAGLIERECTPFISRRGSK